MLLGFLALESSLKITSFTIVPRLSLCALSSSLQHQPWVSELRHSSNLD